MEEVSYIVIPFNSQGQFLRCGILSLGQLLLHIQGVKI
jgi:hypothetical protein